MQHMADTRSSRKQICMWLTCRGSAGKGSAHLRDDFDRRLAAVCMEGPQALVALQERALGLIWGLAALLNPPTDLTQLPLIPEVLHA